MPHFLLFLDNHVVVSAPTGSGKTVVFELAIIRLLHNIQFRGNDPSFKIVYGKSQVFNVAD